MTKAFLVFHIILILDICHVTVKSLSDDCEIPESFPNGSMSVFNKTGSKLRVHYMCNPDYVLSGESKQVCDENGEWEPLYPPKCVKPHMIVPRCTTIPYALHSKIRFSGQSLYHRQGDTATVVCDQDYTTTGGRYKESFTIICGEDGKWSMLDGTKPILSCTIRRCPLPPRVPNALYHYSTTEPLMGEGSRVEYRCQTGYKLVDKQNDYLTCRSGVWEGSIPTCVHKSACHNPRPIHFGHWRLVKDESSDRQVEFGDFKVGTKIEYYCDRGHKLIGSKMLECTDDLLWSKVPPVCIYNTEANWYCPILSKIDNGVCKCAEERSSSLSFCEPFERGVKIECMCNEGYTLVGVSTLTCTHNNEKGMWDEDIPYCIASRDLLPTRDPNDASDHSSDEPTDVTNHISTLVIVIATACSVLGVLLLVMVIVVFRRKKQRPHLFHPGMTPTPYSRVHISSIDDHDRVALMAYADATRVHLPTYEEAMQQGGQFRPSSSSAVTTPSSISTQGSEYRPLPSIPSTIRSIHGGADTNRHSSVTTSTMNRDGTSEIFGSIDTVNVSMSDASTSGTVETFDSGTSNRSMTSQRATAGSLMSSADNLANNDDARLLDNRSENTAELSSQTAIEEKED